MVWLGALWHLLGALPVLADLSPAALVAGVALAALAVVLIALSGRAADPARVRIARDTKAHNRSGFVTRFADPDAPGRPRPRAPSAVTAAA
jgi:hypothetical protein